MVLITRVARRFLGVVPDAVRWIYPPAGMIHSALFIVLTECFLCALAVSTANIDAVAVDELRAIRTLLAWPIVLTIAYASTTLRATPNP